MPKIKEHTKITDKTIKLFAEAIDYAVNACHYNIDIIIRLLCLHYGHKFDTRDEEFVNNYDGEKLIRELVDSFFWKYPYPDYKINPESKEYKLGIYLGELAAFSKIPFRDLLLRIRPTDTLTFLKEHNYEINPDEFEKWVTKIYKKDDYVTRLKLIRDHNKLSQAQLAEKSGVNIRNIQMYEQRLNNINAASGVILQKLAHTLKVRVDDLLETE